MYDVNSFERRIYSQNGEDGIISEIFARIPHGRFFVEFGAEAGLECNTALLARHYNWHGVMIEGDGATFQQLKRNYAGYPVRCLNYFVDRDNIVDIFKKAEVPRVFDLLSIDIDGNDYYVWQATADYRPSVVVVEFNASLGPTASKSIPYNPTHTWNKDAYYGASLTALSSLGNSMGYALIGTETHATNAFFVRKDVLPLCGFSEKTPLEAWHDPGLLRRLMPKASGNFVEP